MEFVKLFQNFKNTSYTWPLSHCRKIYKKQYVQHITICSGKLGSPSQESLPKFEEHLFLMTAFKVYHMCREHGKVSSKVGGVEGASFNEWESVEARDSLEKGKYLASYYIAARLNVCFKLSSFFQCYFRSGTDILLAVCSLWIFFQESFRKRGLHIPMNGTFIFCGGFIFRWRGYPTEVASALMRGEGEGAGGEREQKNFME